MVNNTLNSPGYPHTAYPNEMYCVYLVPIPHGMGMKIYFNDFHLEDDLFCE